MLEAKETALPNEVTEEEEQSLATVILSPINLASPILEATFLEPLSAYALINGRAAADQMTIEVQTFLQCLGGCV